MSHKKRWCCYRNVLDVFLRAFEKDLEQRIDRWKEEKVEKKKASHLDGALLLKMLPAGRSTSDIRRVVNSIFAKGGSKTDYGKLWSDELKRRRTKALGKKEIGRTIADDDGETDSEAEMSGLSDDETEMKDSEGDVMMGDQGPQTVNVVDMWGGVEAVEMRQRFLTLVSLISAIFRRVRLIYLFLSCQLTATSRTSLSQPISSTKCTKTPSALSLYHHSPCSSRPTSMLLSSTTCYSA